MGLSLPQPAQSWPALGSGPEPQPGGRTTSCRLVLREPRGGRVSGGGVHPPLLPPAVGETRGVFVLCWPGVTTWGTVSLSPPGTKTRLATDSQGSGGWGQLGALHLHPHYHDTFLG